MTSGILPGQKWRQGIPMSKIIKNADAAYDFKKTFNKIWKNEIHPVWICIRKSKNREFMDRHYLAAAYI